MTSPQRTALLGSKVPSTVHQPVHLQTVYLLKTGTHAETAPSSSATGEEPYTIHISEISRRRPRHVGFQRDGALDRLAFLRAYMDAMHSHFRPLIEERQRAYPGVVSVVVRILDCTRVHSREGALHVVVESMHSEKEWTLDVMDVEEHVTLYPGKIVLCTGTIFGDRRMNVRTIDEVPLPLCTNAPIPSLSLPSPPRTVPSWSVRLLVAVGPFVSGAFQRLLTSVQNTLRAEQQQRDAPRTVMIILGPLHSEESLAQSSFTYFEHYSNMISSCERVVEEQSTLERILLVPSPLDLIGDYVFPQSALDIDADTDCVLCVANPATVELAPRAPRGAPSIDAPLRIGMCTMDAPRWIAKTMVSTASVLPCAPTQGGPSRMQQIMRDVVRSRLFYPYFRIPGNAGSSMSEPALAHETEETALDPFPSLDLSAYGLQSHVAPQDSAIFHGCAPNILIYSTRQLTAVEALPNGTTFLNINNSAKGTYCDIRCLEGSVHRVDIFQY